MQEIILKEHFFKIINNIKSDLKTILIFLVILL